MSDRIGNPQQLDARPRDKTQASIAGKTLDHYGYLIPRYGWRPRSTAFRFAPHDRCSAAAHGGINLLNWAGV
jgi:hypothetical protein